MRRREGTAIVMPLTWPDCQFYSSILLSVRDAPVSLRLLNRIERLSMTALKQTISYQVGRLNVDFSLYLLDDTLTINAHAS